jgi:hypothetical protein
MAKAASVPQNTDRIVVSTAIWRLLSVAFTQDGSEKNDENHCSENPWGGKDRYFAELNANGKIIKIGSRVNSRTVIAKAYNSTQVTEFRYLIFIVLGSRTRYSG